MLKIPYGISNFETIRNEGYIYVDKTGFIPVLEDAGKYLFLVRPRRFGKSLFISLLDAYYDLASEDRFDRLFSGLNIADRATSSRNGYLVWRLSFGSVDTSRDADGVRQSFSEAVADSVQRFFDRYSRVLGPLELPRDVTPERALRTVVRHAERTGLPVLVLIDEYDNFANDILARGDRATYRSMIHAAGFVRSFFKALKEGAESAFDRILITGVTPVMLDDLTSGFNIATDLSLQTSVHAMFGFTQSELHDIVQQLGIARLSDESSLFDQLAALYNGYRFHNECEPVYNPDMVLHFLRQLITTGEYPEQIIDHNVRTDYGRLRTLALSAPENLETIHTVLADERIQHELVTQFGFERMYDTEYFASLLFYLGLLTIEGRRRGLLTLRIPNYGIKTVYWDYFRRLLSERHQAPLSTSHISAAVQRLAWDGDPEPFARYVAEQVVGKLSRRDFRRFGEKHIKAIIFSLLGLTDFYICQSETELEHGFVDLLLSRSLRFPDLPYEWLIELKCVKEADRDQVATITEQARSQLSRYASSEGIRERFEGATLKMAAFIFIGRGDVVVETV